MGHPHSRRMGTSDVNHARRERWFAMPVPDIVAQLGSDAVDGLASVEASARLARDGPNLLVEARRRRQSVPCPAQRQAAPRDVPAGLEKGAQDDLLPAHSGRIPSRKVDDPRTPPQPNAPLAAEQERRAERLRSRLPCLRCVPVRPPAHTARMSFVPKACRLPHGSSRTPAPVAGVRAN